MKLSEYNGMSEAYYQDGDVNDPLEDIRSKLSKHNVKIETKELSDEDGYRTIFRVISWDENEELVQSDWFDSLGEVEEYLEEVK